MSTLTTDPHGDKQPLNKEQMRLAIEIATRALNGERWEMGGNGEKLTCVKIKQHDKRRA